MSRCQCGAATIALRVGLWSSRGPLTFGASGRSSAISNSTGIDAPRARKEGSKRQETVEIVTIHSAKGLEWTVAGARMSGLGSTNEPAAREAACG